MAYHDEYVELISAAIDGALSPAEQARLDAHLASCPHCKALYNDLEKMQQTLSALPAVEVPAGLTNRILEAVAADNIVALPKKPTLQWKRWAATAAVLALLLVGAGGMGLLNSGRELTAPTSESAETVDPTLARSLPEEQESADLLADDVQVKAAVESQPLSPEEDPALILNTTGDGVAPAPEAIPETTHPVEEVAPIAVATPFPAETPQGSEDNPADNFSVGPLVQIPVMPVPSGLDIPDGQEDEDPGIAVQGISMESGMTEEELAALDRLLAYLELPEGYEWENGVTALWADEETTLRLTYLGLDSEGLCHMFDFSKNSILYLVPVEGGEIITAEP